MKQVVTASALLLLTLALSASGQSLTAPSEWTLIDAQGGFCIEYLVDPALAGKLAPKETVLASAGRGDGLLPAVMRQVVDEPKFASWIPARLCIGLYRSVAINEKVVAQMKGTQPILVITHTLAASAYRGTNVPAVLIGFYSDNSALTRAAEAVGQSVERATRMVTEREGAEFPTWYIEFKGLKLRWNGGPGDEPRVSQTRSVSFGYTGSHGNVWTGVEQVTIPETRTLFGALAVEGKNNLAKALKGSPIRQNGPMESGGQAKISFTSAVKR